MCIAQSCRQEQLKPVHRARAFIIYGPVLFVTVFLHELGHCLATRQVSDLPSRKDRPAGVTCLASIRLSGGPAQPWSLTRR